MRDELIFRLIFIGVFTLALSISTYYRRLARKTGGTIPRRQEGTSLPVRLNAPARTIPRRQEGTLAIFLRLSMTLP